MFEAKLRSKISAILSPLAQAIVSIGITANMLTMFGLLVNLVAAYYLATERLVAAGLLILFGASFDMIDGAVARARTSTNSSGALLDSVIDRYSEAVIFLGCPYLFSSFTELLRGGIGFRSGDWVDTGQLCPRQSGGTSN